VVETTANERLVGATRLSLRKRLMLYMIVERFRGNAATVYERVAANGRMLPDGLTFLDSWVDVGLGRCFQLMTASDPADFLAWAARWADLVDIEVVPVVSGSTVSRVLNEE
jgi:hypothetical protein